MKGVFPACSFGQVHPHLHQKLPELRKSPDSFLDTRAPSCSTSVPPPPSLCQHHGSQNTTCSACPGSWPLMKLPSDLRLPAFRSSWSVSTSSPSGTSPYVYQTLLIAPSSSLTHHFIIALRTALLFRRRRHLSRALLMVLFPVAGAGSGVQQDS